MLFTRRASFALAVGLGLVLASQGASRADEKDKKSPPPAASKQKEKESPKEDPGEKLWITSLDDAKTIAAKEGKEILMEFTGSDWCPPCKALKKQVFDSEVFQTEAPKHFVLLKLDNPRDKSKQSDKEIKQYKTLSKQFGISGVPTVMLADASGKPFSQQVGYGGDEPEKYTKGLVEKIDVRKQRDQALARAKTAEGLERAKLLGEALAGVEGELGVRVYPDTVAEIIKLDADNKAGLKTKYEQLTQLIEVKGQLATIREETKEPAEILKKLETLLADKKPAGEALQEVLFLKGALQYRTDRAASRKTFEAALAAAPKSEDAEQIKNILDQAFKDEKTDAKKTEEKKTESKEESKKP